MYRVQLPGRQPLMNRSNSTSLFVCLVISGISESEVLPSALHKNGTSEVPSAVKSPMSTLFHSHITTKMAPRSLWLRALNPAVRQRQYPILRSIILQRTASTEPPKLVGPMDNAFNRERLAVKHHAAQSAGGYFLMP